MSGAAPAWITQPAPSNPDNAMFHRPERPLSTIDDAPT
jgi:hypothetical protein